LAPLVKENAISRQDYDGRGHGGEAERGAAGGGRCQHRAGQTNLGYTRITATESGRIGATLVPEGRLVGKGEATHLTTIDRLDPVYVNFNIADRDALILRRELSRRPPCRPAKAARRRASYLPDGTEYERTGKLRFHRGPQAARSRTGTISMRVVMPNPAKRLAARHVRAREAHRRPARPNTRG